MIGRCLYLLDAGNVIAWRDDAKVHRWRAHHLSTVVTSHSHGQQPLPLRLLKSLQYVRRIATCRDTKCNVTASAKSDDLARKDIIEADIIAHRRDHSNIVGKSNCWQRRTAAERRGNEFAYQVLGIGGAASIAKSQQGSSGSKSLCHSLSNSDDLLPRLFKCCTAQRHHLAALLQS